MILCASLSQSDIASWDEPFHATDIFDRIFSYVIVPPCFGVFILQGTQSRNTMAQEQARLRAAIKLAEEASDAKSTFLANMSRKLYERV